MTDEARVIAETRLTQAARCVLADDMPGLLDLEKAGLIHIRPLCHEVADVIDRELRARQRR